VDLRRIERLLESHPAVKAAAVVPVAWRGPLTRRPSCPTLR
jgi:acyl-coenzyme A synthetase/AMP-(fatty) acid ligase